MTSTAAEARRRSALMVVCGALLISFAPVFVKAVVPDRVGPTATAFYRTLLGGAFLALLARGTRRSLRLPRPALLLAVLAGLIFAFDLGTWHQSIVLLPRAGAGLSTVLANTQVVWVALAGALVLKEGGGGRLALGVALAVLGVALVAGVLTPSGVPQANPTGVLLGLATGVFYAGYILTLRAGRRRAPSALSLMAWTSAFSALFLALGVVLLQESFTVPDLTSWLCLLGLAIVVQTIAWWILTVHMPRIPAALGALILLLQPTFSTIWGALFFGERLTPYELAGAGLILVAIYLGARAGTSRGRSTAAAQ